MELFHESGSSSVLDATYFRRLFSTAAKGLSSGCVDQKEANCSKVRRPNNMAPPLAIPSAATSPMT